MADNKTLRLNKVLRELNISLDRAVEHLASKGIEIEARPTTKISNKEYEILLDGFQTDRSKKVASKEVGEEKRKEKEAIKIALEEKLEQRRLEDEAKRVVVKAKAEKLEVKTIGKIEIEPKEVKAISVAEEKPAIVVEEPKQVEKAKVEVTKQKPISQLRYELTEVITGLLAVEDRLEGEQETIIGTTVFDLEEAEEEKNESKFIAHLQLSIQSYKDWVYDLDMPTRAITTALINQLTLVLDGTTIPLHPEKGARVMAKDITVHGKIIQNVLVPIDAKEPFQSGGIYLSQRDYLKSNFPELYAIDGTKLEEVSAIKLFQLAQLSHPKEYGIPVDRCDVLSEWEDRGEDGFKQLGFPTDVNYPYVNIHAGYKGVATLGDIIRVEAARFWWWSAVEHARPIANLPKGIVSIDALIAKLLLEQKQYVNPSTNRPKTKPEFKDAHRSLEYEIVRLKLSKQVIRAYLDSQTEEEEEEQSQESLPKIEENYMTRVIVEMHDGYMKSERLSKKKIENLQQLTGAPSLGALWEAVELSWLLWYKRLYHEPIPFRSRLLKMDFFWSQIQPTYAYSDSSKELYKQYSTPCPIGAIIAQYTNMDEASSIFEPSAGNGLLLVGANPAITHVNEIDKSRIKSLEFQRFHSITSNNAAAPFPKNMEKVYDVVVTNPPFARWEDSKQEKAFIIREYFENHRGMNHHIRLEHLMAGLALRTMKSKGKAAIIVMGHISFDDDGNWKTYRPFFSWLYRHYKVDDVINMNSYKLYNKQGAVKETMLILIGGRKAVPEGILPTISEQPQLNSLVDSFTDLYKRVQQYIPLSLDIIIAQLKIAKRQ